MVLWCKSCGALLGLCPPFNDWSTDREGLCLACTRDAIEAAAEPLPSTENPFVVTDRGIPTDE